MASNPTGTALITGGARRTGRAIALALAASGYAVVLHVRRSNDEANGLPHKITEQCGRAHVLSAAILRMPLRWTKSFLQPPHSGR